MAGLKSRVDMKVGEYDNRKDSCSRFGKTNRIELDAVWDVTNILMHLPSGQSRPNSR